MNKYLTSWILPTTVRSLHFQILYLSLMAFVISSKLTPRRRSYVKYTPKIFTEIFTFRSLKGVWLRLGGAGKEFPSNNISDLSWFITRPEHLPNSNPNPIYRNILCYASNYSLHYLKMHFGKFWGKHSAGRIRHFRAEFKQSKGKSGALMICIRKL